MEDTFYTEGTYVVEMVAVYVRIYTEQTPDNRLYGVTKIPGKCDA